MKSEQKDNSCSFVFAERFILHYWIHRFSFKPSLLFSATKLVIVQLNYCSFTQLRASVYPTTAHVYLCHLHTRALTQFVYFFKLWSLSPLAIRNKHDLLTANNFPHCLPNVQNNRLLLIKAIIYRNSQHQLHADAFLSMSNYQHVLCNPFFLLSVPHSLSLAGTIIIFTSLFWHCDNMIWQLTWCLSIDSIAVPLEVSRFKCDWRHFPMNQSIIFTCNQYR